MSSRPPVWLGVEKNGISAKRATFPSKKRGLRNDFGAPPDPHACVHANMPCMHDVIYAMYAYWPAAPAASPALGGACPPDPPPGGLRPPSLNPPGLSGADARMALYLPRDWRPMMLAPSILPLRVSLRCNCKNVPFDDGLGKKIVVRELI